jgi:hypothetical protein
VILASTAALRLAGVEGAQIALAGQTEVEVVAGCLEVCVVGRGFIELGQERDGVEGDRFRRHRSYPAYSNSLSNS